MIKTITILLTCALVAPAIAAEQPDLNMDDLRKFSRRFVLKHQDQAPKAPAIRLAPPTEGTMPNVTPVIPDSVKRPLIFPIKQKPRWI